MRSALRASQHSAASAKRLEGANRAAARLGPDAFLILVKRSSTSSRSDSATRRAANRAELIGETIRLMSDRMAFTLEKRSLKRRLKPTQTRRMKREAAQVCFLKPANGRLEVFVVHPGVW